MQKLCEAENIDKDSPGPKNLTPINCIVVCF